MKKSKPVSAGKTVIFARIVGEIDPATIPANPNVNLDALKAGDDDPLEVVVEIPSGKSKRGWNYTAKAMQDIVAKMNVMSLPGYLGHLSAEEVNYKFPTPVTHWVGAKMENGKAYARGVVDKAASDLKRWIRAGVVNTTSIFGKPTLANTAGEVQVIGYDLYSNDWTPPDRAGMVTKIVGVGEMAELGYEDYLAEMIGDGSHEDLRDALRNAMITALAAEYVYIRKVYEDYVIIEAEFKPAGATQLVTKLLKLSYGIVDDNIQLGEPVEVVEKRIYEPVAGEMHSGEDDDSMKWQEAIKAALEKKEITAQDVAAEMAALGAPINVKPIDLTALGITGEMDATTVTAIITEAGAALTAKKAAVNTALIEKVVKEKVAGEIAQDLVFDKLAGKEFVDETAVAGEIDSIVGSDKFKALVSKLHIEPGTLGSAKPENAPTGLVKRNVRL